MTAITKLEKKVTREMCYSPASNSEQDLIFEKARTLKYRILFENEVRGFP